jgi:hypothetical protein
MPAADVQNVGIGTEAETETETETELYGCLRTADISPLARTF